MIRANKGGPLGAMWDLYIDRKVRRSFRALWTRGALPEGDAPILLYANHASWWDGFIAHQLCRATRRDGYCMMEEENLARYRFLSRIGAFSVRRHEALSSLESLRYARSLLQKPRAVVVIFPEGELHPFGSRDLRLERGVELLARVSVARCVPVAIRAAMFEHELPDVLIDVGDAHGLATLASFEERLRAQVERVAAARSTDGFLPLVRGRSGVAERWDTWRAAGSRAWH